MPVSRHIEKERKKIRCLVKGVGYMAGRYKPPLPKDEGVSMCLLSPRLPCRALRPFLAPALVDGVLDIGQVLLYDAPDKEDLDVVLDCNKLRVVDSGFRCELLVGGVDLESDRIVSELRLVLQEPRQLLMPRGLIDDAVFRSPDAFFLACFALVCGYRSCPSANEKRKRSWSGQ